MAMPARVAGMRIHTLAVLTAARWARHGLVPVEGRLGGAEVAEVVGGVAGVAGHSRDGEVVRRRLRTARPITCQTSSVPITPMSASQVDTSTRSKRRHARVTRRLDAVVEHGQRDDRGQHAHDAQHHGRHLEQRRRRDEPGVDVDARRQARLRAHLQIREDPGDRGFLLGRQRAGGAGMPTKSAPAGTVQMCSSRQAPAVTADAARPRRHCRGTRRRRWLRSRGRTARCGSRRCRRADGQTPDRPSPAASRPPGTGSSRAERVGAPRPAAR